MQQIFVEPDQSEPITHVNNVTVTEQLFRSCVDVKYDLTKQEIIEWWELRKQVIPLYNDQDDNCIKRFKGLWYILTESDYTEPSLKNIRWTQFGFQQQNPVTDLRGGGVQALDDIINFSQSNKQIVQDMIDPINDFYFACSSINVTFFMKKYFHLQEDLCFQKDKNLFCSRKAFKNFCKFLVHEDNIWSQIHQFLLIDLFQNCWLELKKRRPDTTILDYGIALERMQNKCKKAFSEMIYDDLLQLKNFYKSLV